MCPRAIENRQTPTEMLIFAAALNHCPPWAIENVSRLNEENVVKPPHIPTIRKRRKLSGIANLPLVTAIVPTKPMMKQPIKLTAIVPQGKEPLALNVNRVSP